MAKLLKLQISGIRSFGPLEDHSQQVKFSSPLTLILGQNGCGKTTIIEAIKYACTSELPGGSDSGRGFVNDPKLTRSTSTKGQIKLKFQDVKDNEVTIARIVEVIRNKDSLKFSTKSSTVRVVSPDGNDRSVPGRCADITTECCQLLNVAPSVLNNVMFCHQENSAWPLDEGKKLKEKFDEIFDATKYNKAAESMRALQKQKLNNLKVLEKDLQYSKEKKEEIEKKQRNLRDKENKIEEFEQKIQRKNEQLESLKKRIDEILELEKSLSDLERKLTAKEATRDGVVEEQNTIKKLMAFEFEGSDEELNSKIESFGQDRRREEQLVKQLEKRKNEIEEKSKNVYKLIEEAQAEKGKLTQEKNHYLKKCAEINQQIGETTKLLEVNIETGSESNDNISDVIKELEAAAESIQIGLKCLIAEKECEETHLQKNIDAARGNLMRNENHTSTKKQQLKEYELKLVEVEDDLTDQETSEEMMKSFVSKLTQIENTICTLKRNFKETEENEKTDSYRKEIQQLEQNLESLEAECKILRQNDVTEGKIESEKRLIMEKQREIQRIKSKHADNLKQLFGDKVPEKNLKNAVEAIQTKADLTVGNLTENINKKQKEVTTLEVNRQHQLKKITDCESKLKEKEKKILEACNGKDFNETLELSFQTKERLQRAKGQYSSVKVIFAEYIKEFEKEAPCCPVCETDFKQKGDIVKKIIRTLKRKLERVPQQLSKVEEDLKKEECRYDQLQQLKMINGEIVSLKSDILPQLKRELEEIDKNLKKQKTELESLKIELQEPLKKVEISKNVITDVGSVDHNQNDVERCENNLRNLKREVVRVGSNKSKQEVEAEMDSIKAELSELRMKVDAQTKKFNNHRERLQNLADQRTALVEQQLTLKEEAQNRPILEGQKRELIEKINTLKSEITDLEVALISVKAELQDAIRAKETAVKSNKEQIEAERIKSIDYNKKIEGIKNIQMEIESYIENKVDEKLIIAEENLNRGKKNEETLKQAEAKILELISEKKEKLAKQELNFQTLQNNQLLREKMILEAKLEQEVVALKNRIGGYNYKTVYEEKLQLTQQRENLQREIDILIGEKSGLQTTIDELRTDLDQPENKNAHNRYMEQVYEYKVKEISSRDLSKYINALEKAVLEFHKEKMTQINKNIRELWRDIYRGNDIDYIEIKTEQTTSNAKRRVYNYKVVQVKKGVELDMRGRCSAGQKVLACLVIRIALAESLSTNCGILALDEPTTNLDKENIESLAETLSRLVTVKQREKNFQLLVITHDEEFVNIIRRVLGISYFYRVDRDNEGFSRIIKEHSM